MKTLFIISAIIAASPVLVGCDNVDEEDVVSKGDRLLGISVSPGAGEDFGQALGVAADAGVEVLPLPLSWDDLETSPGRFEPDPNFLAVANQFYPGAGVRVALELNPIDTNNDRRPPDLAGLPFDDPLVIERFSGLIDWALDQIPDLDVVSLAVGNEVDALLGADPAAWEAYRRFFDAIHERLEALRPDLLVGVKATFDGLADRAGEELAALNASADVVMATYYPLRPDFAARLPEDVGPDIDRLTSLYDGVPIYLLEAGYPSGSACGSSEAAQAEFVGEIFAAWDRHRTQIPIITFVWLTDIARAQVDEFVSYYGVESECFREFLGSLGLRRNDGRAKEALDRLREEASRRGW